MPVDLPAAETFVLTNARLLERYRFAHLVHGAPAAAVRTALLAYRNPDGGFGNALEPDVRAASSEPVAVLHALEVLAAIDALDDPVVRAAADWIGTVAGPDGGVPFALPAAADAPRAPWMQPDPAASPFTFAVAALLLRARLDHPWLRAATALCWTLLDEPDRLEGYWFKCALEFLDATNDTARRDAVLPGLADRLDPDGSIPVAGGIEGERLTALTLSPHPGAPSRALFTAAQLEEALDELAAGQQEDGGWTIDWLAWSPAATLESRGLVTVRALATLRAHGRI
jgi:hypothetical protein